MAEINIKLSELTQAISELQLLRQACMDSKKNPPDTVGGGKTINEFESITKVYKTLNDHFAEMISSTILFLQKSKEEFESGDKKSAVNIRKN